MHASITSRHLQLLAVVYARQSCDTQIRNNLESPLRQRALQARARDLGWLPERITLLHEEGAKSASSTSGRHAYQELEKIVIQGRVGIILAVEVARWARDNAAWQRLIRECIYAGVLLADEHTVYDPTDPNDRVQLGILGALAEYELGRLRDRMLVCWWNKVRRGEVFPAVPTGYVVVRGKELDKHPDLRVQHSLQRLFEKFRQMPSVLQLCQCYLQRGELLPYVAHGDNPHNVRWLPANYKRLLWLFKNPAYAGAYVIGRTRAIVERTEQGELVRRRRVVAPDQWQVLEKDRFPAYISWQEYQENLAKIRKAATMYGDASRAAAQRGTALLAGLLRCRRCGRPLSVRYDASGPRYQCRGGRTARQQGKPCLSFSGRRIEPLFSEAVLEAVRPAGVAAAERAAESARREFQQRRQGLADELQQRQYEVERARRQYDRVEPENRLVAAELERRWNEAMRQAAAAQACLEAFEQQADVSLTDEEHRRLTDLGQRLERVWDAKHCDMTIKKEIVRLLVEEVIVDVDEARDTVESWIHWKGGHHTPLSAPRSGRRGSARKAEAKRVIGVLRTVCDDAAMARILNRHGVRGDAGRWTAAAVRRFRQRAGIAPFDAAEKQRRGLLSQQEAAANLGISPMSVHRLAEQGILPAKQPAHGMPCIIRKTDLDLPQVRQAVHRILSSLPRPLPADPNQLKLF